MDTKALPVAIFDSGVGGLTVVAALSAHLPHETLHYLGDTARLPYGTKSAAVVERYAMACARFLQAAGAKILVVACNTASAHALAHLQVNLTLPVVGVIGPGAALAAKATRNGRIGVIGTEGTVLSGSYQRALGEAAPGAQVFAQPCPLFVPLAEENMAQHAATRLLAEEYLEPLLAQGIDTLVLGCTHYPLLRPVLQAICGDTVCIIDSASAVAAVVAQQLQKMGSLAHEKGDADQFFATDVSTRLHRVGQAFLGRPLPAVQWVDLGIA